MSEHSSWAPHPDRLFPVEPGTRAIARRLYHAVQKLPILSPHGHVDAALLAEDEPFTDAASLLITSDHYVKRLLHANGTPLEDLGVGVATSSADQSRAIWRRFCSAWSVFRGTPVQYWLASELNEIFGITECPTEHNADAIYDHIAARLALPEFRPRALFDRFGIDVLATTDDPADDLSAHVALTSDPAWRGRVIPTFRPDRYLEVGRRQWRTDVTRLGEVAGVDTATYSGYIEALERRRHYFIEHGATAADHSHADVGSAPLDMSEVRRIYQSAFSGEANPAAATAFRRHMLSEMARMSTDDGLVMTLHPGVRRNHHGPTARRLGPDQGHDIPLAGEFTDSLRPLLERYGTHPKFHLVLFTLDETVYSRELGPLAGFYPSVYIGSPWWFLDAPDAIRRWRSAVTETAGFTRTSGFIDDTRAFCSIPARHDMARRLDVGHLAQLVAEHRLGEDEAFETAHAMVTANPRKVFKL